MKKIFIVFSLVMIAFGASAQKQGLSSIGLSMGYGFDTENATLGIDYRYSITDEFRFAPSLTHYVKKDGLSAWSIDMNAHYVVLLSNQFAFYPIGGLSLSFGILNGMTIPLIPVSAPISVWAARSTPLPN